MVESRRSDTKPARAAVLVSLCIEVSVGSTQTLPGLRVPRIASASHPEARLSEGVFEHVRKPSGESTSASAKRERIRLLQHEGHVAGDAPDMLVGADGGGQRSPVRR